MVDMWLFGRLLLSLLLAAFVMGVLATSIWLWVLRMYYPDEHLVLPFLRELTSVRKRGVHLILGYCWPSDIKHAVIEMSRYLNSREQMRVRNLSRVRAVVSQYALQYRRQSKAAEIAKSKLWPARNRGWKNYLLLFLGCPSTSMDDVMDFSTNYSFVHGKNVATERPEFLITPRSVDDEEVIENALQMMCEAAESVRPLDTESLRPLFEQFALVNELQSMTFQFSPEAHMYSVTEPELPEYDRLVSVFLDTFSPRPKFEPDFYTWLRSAFEQYEAEQGISSRKGRIGRRMAFSLYSLRRLLRQLGRMPVFTKSDEYIRRDEALAESYRQFYPSMKDYVENTTPNGRSDFLYSFGNVLHKAHELCGNYRTMSRLEMFKRQIGFVVRASRQNLAIAESWCALYDVHREGYGETVAAGTSDCPLFDLVVAREGSKEPTGGDKLLEAQPTGWLSDRPTGGPPGRRIWNLVRLLNASGRQISRFVAVSGMVYSPSDYDRVLAIGICGIIPGTILSWALRKRLSVCFMEPLDFFPLPSRLETLMIMDDSLQSGYTARVALENLQRLYFDVGEEQVFTVLKYQGFPDGTRDLFNFVEMGGHEIHRRSTGIITYGYVPGEEQAVPMCFLDKSSAVQNELIDTVSERLSKMISEVSDSRRLTIKKLLRACKSEGYLKPWLLFNDSFWLTWLAARWYRHIMQTPGELGVVASDPMDLPILTVIALIDRFTNTDGRRVRFYFYDAERKGILGDGYEDDLSDMNFIVVDTTIKSGATLQKVKEKLTEKGATVAGLCAMFSKVSGHKLEKAAPRLLVEQEVN